jgi:hypothetical protein
MPIPWIFSSTRDAVALAESRDATPDANEAMAPTTLNMTPSPAEATNDLNRAHDQMYVVSSKWTRERIC